MLSLLDFCAVPSGPSILPAPASRRKSLAFPVGLLPFPAIAEDLARRGLAYLNGSGYLLSGDRLDASEAARLAAVVLEEASLLLPEPRTATLKAHRDKISSDTPLDRARAAEAAPEGFERLASELAATGSRALLAGLDVALAEAHADDDAPDFTAERFALKATADDLRTSSAAQRALLSGVRPHLPAPESVSPDAASAAAFLAALDARPTLRRSELAFLYSEAGSPGALPPAELRRLAEERWGMAIKSSGHYTYRPALAVPPPADLVRVAPAPEPGPAADPLTAARAALAALDAAQGLAPIYSAAGARLPR